MRFVDVPAGELETRPHSFGTLFDDLRARRLTGLVVRGAFAPGALAPALERLSGGECLLPRYPAEHYTGWSWARPLVVSADLEQYFADARAAEAQAAALFSPTDFLGRVRELLSALGGGRRVSVVRRPDGAPHAPLTVRALVPGGEIGCHCEVETNRFASMRELQHLIDPDLQLSFYVPLALPESGGELLVYDMVFGEPSGAVMGRTERTGESMLRAVADASVRAIRAEVGDLLLFDAGRYYHRVTQVSGALTRWTVGGLVSTSPDGEAILHWG